MNASYLHVEIEEYVEITQEDMLVIAKDIQEYIAKKV
jgi:hypothetical protein